MRAQHFLSLMRAALEHSFARNLVSGGLATLVYFLCGLLVVRLLDWPLLFGNACAFIVAFIVSYTGQRFWTFRQATGRHAVFLPRFAAVQAAGLAVNSLIIAVLDGLGCPYELSMIVASALVPLLTYALLRCWVFRSAEERTEQRPYGGLPGFVPNPAPLPPMSQDQTPRVSVIMNCLNSGGRELEEALDSLAAQSFTDFEVIFWDNGSTDNSPLIAQGHAGLRGRLRYFRGTETVPLGAARNLAIREARGELIAFLDCDDLWRPEKLARQVLLFDDPEVGLVCTDTEMFDGRRILQRVFANSAPGRGHVFGDLLRRQWISMSSAVLRRAALDAVADRSGGQPQWFDESLNVCEEADVFYRVAHDWKLDYADAPLTIWRVHGGNTTFRKFGQFADETLRILDKHRALYPGYDEACPDLVLLLRQRAAFQKAVSLWREGRGGQARETLRPWRDSCRKHRLFWLASYLPGIFFDSAVRVYFAIPQLLRRGQN